jgi:TPR repeat protein
MKELIKLIGATSLVVFSVTANADDALQHFHDQAAMAKLKEGEAALVQKDYGKAVAIYSELANNKYSIAEYQMGYLTLHGFGIDKDDLIANAFFLKAAEQGLPQAKFALGTMYLTALNTAQAMPWLKQAALQNDPHALYMAGVMYENGINMPVDPNVAVSFYEKSAQQGFSSALYNLALMLYKGEGVPKNIPVALTYFAKAATAGSAKAQDVMGVFTSMGMNNIAVNQSQALAFFNESAKQGLIEGQYNLGVMYYNGWGVAADEKNALLWITKAADQGLPRATYLEGYLAYNGIGETKNVAQALELYEKAADLGLPDAQLATATLYHNGEGTTKDDIKAFALYQAAAKQGNPMAEYMTGYFYQQGLGIIPDKSAAVTWYEKAAEQGIDKAQIAVASMYANGDGVAQSDKMAYVWLSLAITSSDAAIHNTAQASLDALSKLMKPEDVDAAKTLASSYYNKIAANQMAQKH